MLQSRTACRGADRKGGNPVPLTQKQEAYWRRNLLVSGLLLSIWFVVTFVASFFARELNEFTVLGFPLGFYMAAQGSLIIYVLLVAYYAYYMNRLDREYGADEESR